MIPYTQNHFLMSSFNFFFFYFAILYAEKKIICSHAIISSFFLSKFFLSSLQKKIIFFIIPFHTFYKVFPINDGSIELNVEAISFENIKVMNRLPITPCLYLSDGYKPTQKKTEKRREREEVVQNKKKITYLLPNGIELFWQYKEALILLFSSFFLVHLMDSWMNEWNKIKKRRKNTRISFVCGKSFKFFLSSLSHVLVLHFNLFSRTKILIITSQSK